MGVHRLVGFSVSILHLCKIDPESNCIERVRQEQQDQQDQQAETRPRDQHGQQQGLSQSSCRWDGRTGRSNSLHRVKGIKSSSSRHNNSCGGNELAVAGFEAAWATAAATTTVAEWEQEQSAAETGAATGGRATAGTAAAAGVSGDKSSSSGCKR